MRTECVKKTKIIRIKNYGISLSPTTASKNQKTFQSKTYSICIFALIFMLICDATWLMCQGSLHYLNVYAFNNVFIFNNYNTIVRWSQSYLINFLC